MSKIAERVQQYAAPIAEQLNLTLWHVEYGKEATGYVLRLIIDKPGGVGTDDCEALSRAIDPWLDETDFIPDAYCLEVSSPGIERVLHTDEQRRQFIGSDVTIKLYKPIDGARVFQGVLVEATPDIAIDSNGRRLAFAKSDIAVIQLLYKG